LTPSSAYIPSSKIHAAALDLRYLLKRGYTRESSLRFIVDRYLLSKKDRMILFRSVYSNEKVNLRIEKKARPNAIENQVLRVDGYNVLITVETGIERGFLVRGDDLFLRDVAGRHKGYSTGSVTDSALIVIIDALANLKPQRVTMLFDRPISQSGDLATKCMQLMASKGILGVCETSQHVDRELLVEQGVICSSDSVILDAAQTIFDLADYSLQKIKPAVFKFKS
jgi:hypothetical protein